MSGPKVDNGSDRCKDCQPALTQFALISSVSEAQYSYARLRAFGEWLSLQINKAAANKTSDRKVGAAINVKTLRNRKPPVSINNNNYGDSTSDATQLAKAPLLAEIVFPSSPDAVDQFYAKVFQHPSNIEVVFHILPCHNSIEYKWMKTMSDKRNLVSQGILYENANRHFRCDDIKDVGEVAINIYNWIDSNLQFHRRRRRLEKLLTSGIKTSCPVKFSSPGDAGLGTKPRNICATAVDSLLLLPADGNGDALPNGRLENDTICGDQLPILSNGHQQRRLPPTKVELEKKKLNVYGIPSSFTTEDVIELFSSFDLSSVTFGDENGIMETAEPETTANASPRYKMATIELQTKWMALQLCEYQKLIKCDGIDLVIVPLSPWTKVNCIISEHPEATAQFHI